MGNKGRMLNSVALSSFCSLFPAEQTLNCQSTLLLKDSGVLQLQGDSAKYHEVIWMILTRIRHAMNCVAINDMKQKERSRPKLFWKVSRESKVHLHTVGVTVARRGHTLIGVTSGLTPDPCRDTVKVSLVRSYKLTANCSDILVWVYEWMVSAPDVGRCLKWTSVLKCFEDSVDLKSTINGSPFTVLFTWIVCTGVLSPPNVQGDPLKVKEPKGHH